MCSQICTVQSTPLCTVGRTHRVGCHLLPCKSSYLGQRIGLSCLARAPGRLHKASLGVACPTRRQVTVASVFGVGAPEALLVGVVALVVFGPKGLAEAAKSLGQSLKGFAPTIRELAGVSNELKQTLEQEIGLDEIRREWRDGSLPPSMRSRQDEQPEASSSNRLEPDEQGSNRPAEKELKEVSEEMAQQIDPEIAKRRAESARMAWGNTSNSSQPSNESQELEKNPVGTAAAPRVKFGDMEGMSIEELEAELARRRSKAKR
ncbi:hypothetical protein ABBQ38_009521 [Trebouxia sp. C0009 RCD-2024]